MSRVKRLFHESISASTIVALFILWGCSAGFNFLAIRYRVGSADWFSFAVMAAAAIAIDLLKARALVVIHKHWRNRSYVRIGVAGSIWLVAVVLAVISCWNFLAVTITDTTNERSMGQYATSTLKRQIEAEQNQLTKAEDRKLTATRDVDVRRADEEIRRIDTHLEELRNRIRSERSPGSADPFGEMMADQFGWPVKSTKFWTIFAFLLAVEICASAGFYGYLTDEPPAKKISPNSPNLERPRPPRVKGKPKLKVVASTEHQRHANRFLSALERDLGAGNSVAQSRLFSRYESWCAQAKETLLSPQKIGLALKAIGVDRQGSFYVLPLAKEKPPGSGSPAA